MSTEISIQIAVTFSIVFYSIIGPERFVRAWDWWKSFF